MQQRCSECCNTLQHTATHRNTLQHTATHRNTPQQIDAAEMQRMLSVRKDVEAKVDQMLAEFNAEKALKDAVKATGGGVAKGVGMYVCLVCVCVGVGVGGWECVCVCVYGGESL